MKKLLPCLAFLFVVLAPAAFAQTKPADTGWVRVFDGKTLRGWKASEHPDSFRVEDGAIVVNGPRGHLFYNGPVGKHDFRDFELRMDVKTTPGSNSGVYFHTAFQPQGWPAKGYEVQVNQTHRDPKKTGGLYNIKDVTTAPAKDNVWFHLRLLVRGKKIVVKVDGKTVVEFTEPKDYKPPKDMPGRKLTHGTFALQAHDPNSKVYFKNIDVKLPK